MRVGWNARTIAVSWSVLAPLVLAPAAYAGPSESLVASAKAEGQLNVIALPRDWCGFGRVIDGFKARYGLHVNELRPDAPSADELKAIRTKRNDADAAPDVIDVGLPFAAEAKRDGLLQPYKVSTWDTIPGSAKDADGYWYGDYFGVLAFEVNADLVTKLPRDWRDLLAPEYKGAVALSGELTSNQAILAVFAAGLSATGGRVDGAAEKGMAFFAELNRRGNFNSYFGDSVSLADGRTPVLIRWDYLGLSDRDSFKGKHRVEVVRPRSGSVAGVYVQAISAFAPHPNAARLWMEHLYSDEVQLAFLEAHCSPIRLAGLLRDGKVPVGMREQLPLADDDGSNADPVFPTIEEQERAREIIIRGWGGIVGVTVMCYPEESLPGPMSGMEQVSPRPAGLLQSPMPGTVPQPGVSSDPPLAR